MDNKDIQRLLQAAGYYTGLIDGYLGAKSWRGINEILFKHVAEVDNRFEGWTAERQAVAAAQLVLKHAGFEVGVIDGYAGNQTEGALLEWEHEQVYGYRPTLERTPVVEVKSRFPTQDQCRNFYGAPGSQELERRLVYVPTPYVLRIDYNLNQSSSRIRIHERCADSLSAGLQLVYKEYGYDRICRLGLDRFAGSYVPRKMRGGDSWSMHAYGCAVDWYAGPNGLTVRCPAALFCKPEYDAFFDIWESVGWVSLGRAIGRDWMHIQAARL